MMYLYWDNINKIQTRTFSRKKGLFKIGINKSKHQRINIKKGLIKSRSTSLLLLLKLQVLQSVILNVPPLSNLLNLYGINSIKFCEDISKDLQIFNIKDFLFIINIYIFKDLSYKYILSKFKFIYLLKMLSINFLFNSNICLLSYNIRKKFINMREENFVLMDDIRNFYFLDLLLLYKFISYSQELFFKFNLMDNNFKFYNYLSNIFINPEMIINNNKSLLYTLQFKLKILKIKNK